MLERLSIPRKQRWMIGIAFCGLVSLTSFYYAIKESGLALPSKSTTTSTDERIKESVDRHELDPIEPDLFMSKPSPMVESYPSLTADSLPLAGPKFEPIQPKPSKISNQVALTFDDGPDNKYTPIILDILKNYDVKATFFT